LRIISGLAKGRKLHTPANASGIRPTTDRAREALFSIIGSRVSSASVLDLYAGTAALGLEAFSRGAKQVVFVDKHRNALELIKKNCRLCCKGIEDIRADELIVIKHDLRRGLHLVHSKLDESSRFDLIFLDPPYKKGLAEQTLHNLDTSQLLQASTLVIAEESSKESLPDSLSNLVLFDQRRYGDTAFWFYSVKGPSLTQT